MKIKTRSCGSSVTAPQQQPPAPPPTYFKMWLASLFFSIFLFCFCLHRAHAAQASVHCAYRSAGLLIATRHDNLKTKSNWPILPFLFSFSFYYGRLFSCSQLRNRERERERERIVTREATIWVAIPLQCLFLVCPLFSLEKSRKKRRDIVFIYKCRGRRRRRMRRREEVPHCWSSANNKVFPAHHTSSLRRRRLEFLTVSSSRISCAPRGWLIQLLSLSLSFCLFSRKGRRTQRDHVVCQVIKKKRSSIGLIIFCFVTNELNFFFSWGVFTLKMCCWRERRLASKRLVEGFTKRNGNAAVPCHAVP